MPIVKKMADLDLRGKRVLIREDLNAPIKDGKVTSDARLKASAPTVQLALERGAAVIVMSHLGRPKEGEADPTLSLKPVADRLGQLLGRTIPVVSNWIDGVQVQPGEVVLCENVRFQKGEKKDDEALARKMAALCDIYVMDAFGTAHRAEASTHGVAKFAPVACAGPLLSAELDALGKALEHPRRPLVAVVGGSKVSTKLEVLNSLVALADRIIVGGGIANTFLMAAGYKVGKSLMEADLADTAKDLMQKAKARGAEIPLPVDVICAKQFAENAEGVCKHVADVADDDFILDVGPETSALYARVLRDAGTVVWNGPLGVFEFANFAAGTMNLARAIADSQAFSLAGGGDTLAAIEQAGVTERISYVSTGGGAFLEFVEGKKLPAVAALEARA